MIPEEQVISHLSSHIAPAAGAGDEAQGDSSRGISRSHLLTGEYQQVFLDFTEHDGKGLTLGPWSFQSAWGNEQTDKRDQFWADLQSAVLEMLDRRFRDGWILDGPYEAAVMYKRRTGYYGLFDTETLLGAWVRLRRLQTR